MKKRLPWLITLTMLNTITVFAKVPANDLDVNKRLKSTSISSCTDILYIPDMNLKQALLEHGVTITGEGITKIDINEDGEISISEAEDYTGTINVSGKNISRVEGIEAFTALTELDVSGINDGMSFFEFYFSSNIALRKLNCSSNMLAVLDVSSNTALEYLNCSGNNFTELDVSSNTSLEYLDCSVNHLGVGFNLNVSNTPLTTLLCSNTVLTELDVSSNIFLEHLDCSYNNLISLNVANGNNINLTKMNAKMNFNLSCIQHDNGFSPFSNSEWIKDSTALWSENCETANLTNEIFTNTVKIHPNPVKEMLHINTTKIVKGISVFNVLGKKIVETTKKNINVSKLNNGIYILKITGENNKIDVNKFVKEM